MIVDAVRQYLEKLTPLDEETWRDLKSRLHASQLKRRDHFLSQGDICKQVGFIRKGYVRLYYLVDGEEITKDFNFENAFCGSHASFSAQTPSRFNVVAMEDCEFYVISREDLYSLYDRYKSFERIGRLYMEYMFDRKERRESAFLQDDAGKRYSDLRAEYPQIVQRVPLKYIASYLGITAETLSRIRAK
jgi:CRP-like cAMP-binding protein